LRQHYPQSLIAVLVAGKIEKANEVMLVVKTRAALLDELITLVKQNHPYTVSEIIALPIIGGNPDYLTWLEKETG